MKCSKRKRIGTTEELQMGKMSENKWEKNIMAPPLPVNYHQQQMINDSNCYFRSDVSVPLSLKTGEASNNFFYAEQPKLEHLILSNYQIETANCTQAPYPINNTNEELERIHQIDKFLNSSNYGSQLHVPVSTSSAVSSYLTQLSQYQPGGTKLIPNRFYEQTNNVATSSYYTLTPASSTTSLNDFALLNSSNFEKQVCSANIQRKCTLSRTDSKKRTRTATIENTDINNTATTANSKKANASTKTQGSTVTGTEAAPAPRRRGRPPKNATQSISQLPTKRELPSKTESLANDAQTSAIAKSDNVDKVSQSASNANLNRVAKAPSNLNRSNSSIDSSTTSKFSKSNKLMKSLINKSSSNSNLQKSKVQTSETLMSNTTNKVINDMTTNENKPQFEEPSKSNPPSVQASVVSNPLVNKSNVILNQNVNNKVINTQSQITGYLLDKVNTACQNIDPASKGLNSQDYAALKVAGVNLVKPVCDKNSQLNSVNKTIYTGYYNKVKSIRSSTDLNITTEEYGQKDQQTAHIAPSTPMPKLSWANNHDLWETMRKKDAKYLHDPFYLKRHSNIEPQMRAILIDWLVEISYAYRLHRETWHLALEYMDRFMTCSKQQMRVDRLQLIGMTCLFLAAKVEEIYPPKLKELASHMENYSNNNEDAISQFELFILKTLNWEISPVTANTWLMTFIQIASINYYSLLNNAQVSDQPLSSHMVMPLNIYKNSNANKLNATLQQQQFYIKNYMKSVTLLDLCMFEMDSMKFSYSVLAASAMYHMVSYSPAANQANIYTTPLNQCNNSSQLAARIVELSTGYKLYELDACIKWMYPFADVCKDILTEEKMTFVKSFSSVDQEDSHNIQLYHQNLELLKEAQSRKTPCKFYSNQAVAPIILTPPDSHRKFSSSSCSNSNLSISSSTPANLTLTSNTSTYKSLN